jgi:hypothetical protein
MACPDPSSSLRKTRPTTDLPSPGPRRRPRCAAANCAPTPAPDGVGAFARRDAEPPDSDQPSCGALGALCARPPGAVRVASGLVNRSAGCDPFRSGAAHFIRRRRCGRHAAVRGTGGGVGCVRADGAGETGRGVGSAGRPGCGAAATCLAHAPHRSRVTWPQAAAPGWRAFAVAPRAEPRPSGEAARLRRWRSPPPPSP